MYSIGRRLDDPAITVAVPATAVDLDVRAAARDVERLGYAILQSRQHDRAEHGLGDAFDRLVAGSGSGSERVSPKDDLVRELFERPDVRALAKSLVGGDARPIRAIAFDKTSVSNWLVPWHQDRTIAVDQRDDRAEVRNWTVKRGIVHCEPPVQFLEGMLTLRWHLDAMEEDDGCIKVLPGTQRLGRLSLSDIASHLASASPVSVPIAAGDVFVMRPLLVHSSRKRTTIGRRRVLHIEIAVGDPPVPLKWAWS